MMQDRNTIPTRLIPLSDRPKVEIAPLRPLDRRRYLRSALAAISWIVTAARARRRGPEAQRRDALSVRATLEDMGGVWIKLGQLLAMRNDLFSDVFCEVMAGLQDRATGFPFSETKRIIEAEYGAPLATLFTEFEEHPFAAGSIGQLHAAQLADGGMRVAVKVQRPDAAEKFRSDLKVLRFIAELAATLRVMPEMSWHDLIWELERTLGEELDYRLESASIRRMRVILRSHGIFCEADSLVALQDGGKLTTVSATDLPVPFTNERWHMCDLETP
jgi:ubiquinone biosynthesis protein